MIACVLAIGLRHKLVAGQASAELVRQFQSVRAKVRRPAARPAPVIALLASDELLDVPAQPVQQVQELVIKTAIRG